MRSVGGDGATRRRHPQEGGYACGEETRARIIAAALRIFGELGYDRYTVTYKETYKPGYYGYYSGYNISWSYYIYTFLHLGITFKI